jgi:hypothetical protein
VHDTGIVRGLQREPGLPDDVERAIGRQPAEAREQCRQRLAVDVLHDEERHVADFAVIEDVRDAGMRQRGGVFRFGPEPVQEPWVGGVLRFQHLDRDPAIEDDVAGAPDLTHAADGDTLFQRVPIREGEVR